MARQTRGAAAKALSKIKSGSVTKKTPTKAKTAKKSASKTKAIKAPAKSKASKVSASKVVNTTASPKASASLASPPNPKTSKVKSRKAEVVFSVSIVLTLLVYLISV